GLVNWRCLILPVGMPEKVEKSRGGTLIEKGLHDLLENYRTNSLLNLPKRLDVPCGFRNPECEPHRQRLYLQRDRLRGSFLINAEPADLGRGGGDAGWVAEPLEDGEGFGVAALGFIVVPAVLGEDAELVVAVGDAGLVTEPLEDGEGLGVAAFGFGVVPAAVGEHAELVDPGGAAGGFVGGAVECVGGDGGRVVPRPPGFQRPAGLLGHLGGGV